MKKERDTSITAEGVPEPAAPSRRACPGAYGWRMHASMLLPLLGLLLVTGIIYGFWGEGVRVRMEAHRFTYPMITRVMNFFTDWGDKFLYAVYAVLLIRATARRDKAGIRFYLRYAVAAILFAVVLTQLLKAGFGMPRPGYAPPRDPFSFTSAYSSFPSGHTVSIIIAAMPMAFRLGSRWAFVLASLLIAVVGYSRIWLGVHHPVDILAGMALGSFAVWSVFRVSR